MSEQAETASELRDGALGPLSSHPYWIDRRDKWLRRGCFFVLGLVWWYILRVGRRADQWLADPLVMVDRLLWPAAIAVFILSMLASLSLCGQIVIRIRAKRGFFPART